MFTVLGRLSEWFQNLFWNFPEYESYTLDYDIGLCSVDLYSTAIDNCSVDSVSTCNETNIHHFYETKVTFQIAQWHSIDDIVRLVSEIQTWQFNMSFDEDIYLFRIQEWDFGYRDRPFSYSLKDFDSCEMSAKQVRLTRQKTCPLVSLSLSDHDCFEDNVGLTCPSQNITVRAGNFFFSSNYSNISVCSDVYLEKFTAKSSGHATTSSNVAIILSIACCTISLLCLLLSFLTFCLFPRLRTVPGRNNMALILSLIIAQMLFLVSSFGHLKRGSNACKIVGLLTHFSWLVTVFWMNVCTFHAFRVFTGMNRTIGSGRKTFLAYSAYTVGLSVLPVLTNIIISTLSSDDFGYGNPSCYISSEKMVGFTFGIPVGFVIITNLIMFLIFIVKVKRAPTVNKDVKNERNDIIIFAKLSSLTGFTWIFGFIYSWTDLEVFSCLFIVLNASQGVFLFLSFVCNRRVFDMYRNRSFGVTSTSNTYKTRVTDVMKSKSAEEKV